MILEDTASGYLHPQYVQSFTEFGTPLGLPRCGGWLLRRQIPGTSHQDLTGCYPLFACKDWSGLSFDLDLLQEQYVSVAIVPDPMNADPTILKSCFPRVTPFKEHFVTDLSKPLEKIVSKHHSHYSKRALEQVSVEECEAPMDHLDDWMDLYGFLVKKRGLKGIQAGSRTMFQTQFRIPGMTMFRASHNGQTVGLHLWSIHHHVAYGHLGATNDQGYSLMASYALYWFALSRLAERVPWANLGGTAGISDRGDNGLHRFKTGWATGTKTAYFCGRILNQERYTEIAKMARSSPSDYFPAYRYGEFGQPD